MYECFNGNEDSSKRNYSPCVLTYEKQYISLHMEFYTLFFRCNVDMQ